MPRDARAISLFEIFAARATAEHRRMKAAQGSAEQPKRRSAAGLTRTIFIVPSSMMMASMALCRSIESCSSRQAPGSWKNSQTTFPFPCPPCANAERSAFMREKSVVGGMPRRRARAQHSRPRRRQRASCSKAVEELALTSNAIAALFRIVASATVTVRESALASWSRQSIKSSVDDL
jgi:hypothetical protein